MRVLFALLLVFAILNKEQMTESNCSCKAKCEGMINWHWDKCPVDKNCPGVKFDWTGWNYFDCCKQSPDQTYEAQTALEKAAQIQDKIAADAGKGSQPFAAGIFNESVITTFRNISDEMPPGRVKYIHSVGWVAQFEFTPVVNSPFTGVFAETSHGFIRLSLAKPQSSSNITPGFGIKFLRDTIPSCNFVAMPSLNGQSDKNYFKNTFTNHPTPPSGSLPLRLVAVKFEQASSCPAMVGISHCTTHDSKGNNVQDPKFPFEVLFEPASDVQQGWDNVNGASFQDTWFRKLPTNSKIFDVMYQATPEDRTSNNKQKMGEIRNTTSFNTSKQADSKLFFRHDWIENDFALRKDWYAYMKTNKLLKTWTGNDDCSMTIPNLNCD